MISEILDKLLHKACYRFKIFTFERPKPKTAEGVEVDAEAEPEDAPSPSEPLAEPHVFPYPEKVLEYDSFIETMWRYLDLMDRTSHLIEDLYIYILDALHLNRTNPYTIFKSIHWQGFRNIILKDPIIRKIMKELQLWRHSGHAVGNPGEWIDKINFTRGNSIDSTSSYSELFKKHGRCEMLHQACDIALGQV